MTRPRPWLGFAACGAALALTLSCQPRRGPGPGAADPRPPATANSTRQGIVATYHRLATEAGIRILNSGGNAFDAFVAATLAEYVVAEGGTSLAGPLGVLVYEAKGKTVEYLDAEFNDVKDPRGRWTPGEGAAGKMVLAPGAVAGLEALSKRRGRLTFAQAIEPAARLARDGFPIDSAFRASLLGAADLLKADEYARRTFFPGGRVLGAGEVLKQPEVARFLEQLSRQGSAYMYRGDWAKKCVQAVRAAGGLMTLEDLASYQPAWHEPWEASYRGYRVYACSGRAFGGLWGLMALKTVEQVDLARLGHFSTSAEALEVMVRTARETGVGEEPWLFDYRQLDNRGLVQSRLRGKYAEGIWARVAAKLPPRRPVARPGSHSYHIVVVDREGNAASGTNTHESVAWGNGVFIEGIPLTSAGRISGWETRPGERRLSPFTIHLAFQDGDLRIASGSFSSSILEASFQFLVNLIDYRLSARDAVSLPRFGTYLYNPSDLPPTTHLDTTVNWLDPRISPEIVEALKARGLKFQQQAAAATGYWIDVGLGTAVVLRPDGSAEGATAPWFGTPNPPGTVQATAGQVR